MRVAILTSGRQDWGILRSTVEILARDPEMEVHLLWGGTHAIEATAVDLPPGLDVEVHRLDWIGEAGVNLDPIAHASRALAVVGEALDRDRPDALLLAGDRFETIAAAIAATLLRIPIAHLHGGEETLGAIDNAMRHAITKLSHLHLVSHDEHRDRIIAMGEDPSTVHVVGAPGLDNATRDDLPNRDELEGVLGIPLSDPVVIATVHPATLSDDPAREARVVAEAMDAVPATYVVTLPNLDPGNRPVREIMQASAEREGRTAVSALGARAYWGLMNVASAMLGNSSSGLIEAPAVPLPVVNVGNRQAGRPRAASIIDVVADPEATITALRRALSPQFRAGLRSSVGEASAPRIAAALRAWAPTQPPAKAGIDVSVRR